MEETKTVDWAAVWETTYEDLVQYLYRRTGDGDRAQDIAQEAFVRALGHAPANPRAWLFTCAWNLMTTEARTAARRRRHLELVAAESDTVAAEDPVRVIERNARRAAVEQALALLSDRDREVLLLRNAGLSYPEIADATGLSIHSIGTTLSRARRRLAAALDNVEDPHVALG